MLNTQIGEIENELFTLEFIPEENKINFWYNGDKRLDKTFFSIKDRDSNACIWSFENEKLEVGHYIWCVPMPKEYFDFASEKNFTGFKIECYKSKKDLKPFYQGILEIKKPICKKMIPSSPTFNFDQTFVNYNQFFVDWIYNGFFAGARVTKAMDIGANVGLFTEWVLDRFGSDTEVISVEPNLKAIDGFVVLHGEKKNVKLEKFAVTSKSGEILQLGINQRNSLISSLNELAVDLNEKQEVVSITLSDLMEKHGWKECDLLKIDIEGGEYDIFQAITAEELRRFKFLLIEFHFNKGRISDILDKMRESNFHFEIREDDSRYLGKVESYLGTIFATRID